MTRTPRETTIRTCGRVACAAGIALAASTASPVRADAFDGLGTFSDEDFERLAENLGAGTHHRAVAPAEPLGLIGFDVAVEVTATDVENTLFERAGDGDDLDTLVVPRLHVQKGLPFGIDVGAMAAAVPGTDATLLGAELRYAVVEGGVATPAVSLRASYSTLQGVDELELDNYALEAGISKGFLMFTPYAGAGYVWTRAEAPEEAGLDEASVGQGKLFAGVNVNLGVNVGLEVDRMDDFSTYSAKLGFRF